MFGTRLPLRTPKGAGALLTLRARLMLASLVCVTMLSARAEAADLALHVVPKTQREAPVSVSSPFRKLFEEFLRWRRGQPH